MPHRSEVEILLVEDNPSDVELTLRTLKKHGLANSVVVLRDGAEALEFLLGKSPGGRPRLVLLDLKLPKVDGLQLLQQIRADERTRTLPVVIMTSSNEERDVVESYRLGVNSYVVKPVEFELFSKTVAELGLYWVLVNRYPPAGRNARPDAGTLE